MIGTIRSLEDGGRGGNRLLYILAASHSGSTLLAMLLGCHPEICTVGEIKLGALGNVDEYRCSCREPIRICPFWREVVREMERRGHTFDIAKPETDFHGIDSRYIRFFLRPLHREVFCERLRDLALSLSSGWREILPRILVRNEALIETLCALAGKRIVVDSSKVGIRLKYLLRSPGLDVRIIRLVRDGRAVSLTYMDPARFADAADPRMRCGGAGGGSRDAERLTIRKAAWEWRRSNEEADALLKRLDRNRWIEVKYEDLCREPEATLRRIYAFAGVGMDATLDNFRDREHHVIGNGMRLDTTSEIRLDERWRSVLGARHLEAFEEVAGEMKRRLGYA